MSNNDHLEIAFTSMEFFQNDGSLNEKEFNQLLDIALKDGSINYDEKRVLTNVINRLSAEEMSGSFEQRIYEVKKKYNI